jgi:hypothetical protein
MRVNMSKKDESTKLNKVDSPKQDKADSPKWNKLDRIDIYNLIMISIMIISLLCSLNFFGYVLNIGDELNYQNSCTPFTQDYKTHIKDSEGDRVKFTGTIIDDASANDVRMIFLQPDGSSDSDRICVIIDSDEREGVEGDLVTVYGFVYGTHLSSRTGYYVPLIVGRYIVINKSKYA